MAANHTEHYELNQWLAADQVLRTDFNADNAKLDAALEDLESRKANQSALSALSSTMSALSANLSANLTKITFGSYSGDNAASRTVSLGFTPKAVFLMESQGRVLYYGGTSLYYYGGLAINGYPVTCTQGTVLQIVSGGFQVYKNGTISSNVSNSQFRYIAFH